MALSYGLLICMILISIRVDGFTQPATIPNIRRSITTTPRPLSFPKSALSNQHHHHKKEAITTPTTRLFSTPQKIDFSKIIPEVSPQRWIQLAYLSLLALLSDWICFSVAASPSTFEMAYPGHSAANLIDMFLFTNVASCFLVTDTVNRFGLGNAIKGSAVVMTIGCMFRSGLGFAAPVLAAFGGATPPDSAGLVPYWSIVAGTLLVGASQPFFQCTPPMLSAMWFGSDERATSTAVALNFNQIGIATAFLVGGSMASDSTGTGGLAVYFGLISAISVAVTAGTLVQFEDRPDLPPSSSELEKLIQGEEEPPFFDSVKKFFATPGFSKPLAAFICSISVTNIVGTFIDEVLERGGITSQDYIDYAGAGFEIAILVGGIIIGGYVDKTKAYKRVTLTTLAIAIATLIPLGLTDHALGQEPVLLLISLISLGLVAGPIQPINAELAVDITYPSDETAVESVQQIGGNLVSALLVPVAEWALHQDYVVFEARPLLESDIRGDVILLFAICCVTFVYYSSFDAPLLRTEADNKAELLQADGAANGVTFIAGAKKELDSARVEIEKDTVKKFWK